MKAVIGVVPLFDEAKDSIWMLPGYMEGIRTAGGESMSYKVAVTSSDGKWLIKYRHTPKKSVDI